MFGADINKCSKTIISKEYSMEWMEGMDPYYPINDERNNILAEQYRSLGAQELNVILVVDWLNINIMIWLRL